VPELISIAEAVVRRRSSTPLKEESL